jgi:hypothetical protein
MLSDPGISQKNKNRWSNRSSAILKSIRYIKTMRIWVSSIWWQEWILTD